MTNHLNLEALEASLEESLKEMLPPGSHVMRPWIDAEGGKHLRYWRDGLPDFINGTLANVEHTSQHIDQELTATTLTGKAIDLLAFCHYYIELRGENRQDDEWIRQAQAQLLEFNQAALRRKYRLALSCSESELTVSLEPIL